jgi:hypothetical protein
MHDSEGTDVAILKKILQDKRIQKEQEFLRRLTPDQRGFYQRMNFST